MVHKNLYLAAILLLVSASATHAVLVLDDPLNGSTIGTRQNGTFVAGGGWRIRYTVAGDSQNGPYDCIYWHVPVSSSGAFEYDVRGIGPDNIDDSGVTPYDGSNELSCMYDWTYNNSDNQYTPGFRENPYKEYIRKQGGSRLTTLECIWCFVGGCASNEDTGTLGWNPAVAYHFRLEWAANTPTNGTTELRVKRDGVTLLTQNAPGSFSPGGWSVRIGASTRHANEDASLGAIYSNVKVYDLTIAPTEVTIDLGSPDVSSGLTNPQGGDGDTTPATIGGRTGRRNLNPAEDSYFYFAVADAYAYQANKPDQYIIIDYYDTGTSTLTLEYDSNTGNTPPAFYKVGGSVTLTNTNTWKSKLFHVTDAYFGNRQNGSADFRIGDVGNTFYLDFIRVTTNAPAPPDIAEVSPDPKLAFNGAPCTQQLVLIQGDPAPSWTMLEGPPGSGVSSGGLVSGWTPSTFGDVSFNVQATNLAGFDTEGWVVRVVSRYDFDLDNDADSSDFGHLQECLSGDTIPYGPGCADADANGDGDVDTADFNMFLPCMAGPGHIPGC